MGDEVPALAPARDMSADLTFLRIATEWQLPDRFDDYRRPPASRTPPRLQLQQRSTETAGRRRPPEFLESNVQDPPRVEQRAAPVSQPRAHGPSQ